MKKINYLQVKRPALNHSRFQTTKLSDLISLYSQWNNYAHSVSQLTPTEQTEINRLEHILRQFLPNWEEKLLEKHVAVLEKNDWWGIGQEFEQINPVALYDLHSEWTSYQKLAGNQIKPAIQAKIKFVQKVYSQRVSLNQPYPHSPPTSHHNSREPFAEPPTR